MPHRVAVLAFEGISPFHLSVPCLVLGEGVNGRAPGRYSVTVCAERPGRLPTNAGFAIDVDRGLRVLATADTIVLPSWDLDTEPSPRLLGAIRRAHARGARVVGLCLGSFLVAAAGLVDERVAVTHWSAAGELARRHPEVTVRSDLLWSDLGDVVTSAGTAAALDCCLHLVRSDHGVEAAAALARAIVLAPHRGGSQAQYIPAPVPSADSPDPVEAAMVWARTRLDEPITIDGWARASGMSRRTFTRRFRERTGVSGLQWLLEQRLDRARLLLETTEHAIDRVAAESGFGSAEALRHHFRARLGTTPAAHRTHFARRSAS